MSVLNSIRTMLLPLKQSLNNLIARGTVEGVDDSKAIQRIRASLLSNEVHPKIERFQNYGFTANPTLNSDCLTIFQNGNRTQGYVIAVEDRKFRLKGLESGEVALYTDEGDKIVLKRSNTIEVTTKTLNIISENTVNITTKNAIVNCDKVEITSPEIIATSSIKIDLNTPQLNVSGLISCSGIGAGAPPVPGKAVIGGNIESSGNVIAVGVSDNAGSMSDIRTKYNGHTHPSNGVPNPLMN